MVTTRKQALDLAALVKTRLERIYGPRLRGVYLYGSAARDQLNEASDVDIAVVLDDIPDRFAEHERVSELGSQVSLDHGTLVSFLLASDSDFGRGRYAIHRVIKEEGIEA
ncbi:MAG TPA: nucleotidyltransferase domain-containing protein [Phycisphaerales bacterium]|nr:nucleotidyltransferase domain-containing protein [Phycisphaerales bacterium]